MSKGAEQRLKDDAHVWLKGQQAARRLWFFKVHGSRFQRSGVPDFVICVGGFLFAPELKDEREHASPSQRRQIALIRAAGGISGVVRSLDALKRAVECLRVHDFDGARACLDSDESTAQNERGGEQKNLQFFRKKRL